MSLSCAFRSDVVAVMPNLVLYLSYPHSSLAGPHRARQGSVTSVSTSNCRSSTGRDLRVLRKNDEELTDGSAPTIFYTIKKESASAQPAAARHAYPAVTALDACGAVCAAIGGLGEPEAPQPPGANTAKLLAGWIRAFVLRSWDCRRFWSRSMQGLALESAWRICSLFAPPGRVRLLRHVFRARRVDAGEAILTTAARNG